MIAEVKSITPAAVLESNWDVFVPVLLEVFNQVNQCLILTVKDQIGFAKSLDLFLRMNTRRQTPQQTHFIHFDLVVANINQKVNCFSTPVDCLELQARQDCRLDRLLEAEVAGCSPLQ